MGFHVCQFCQQEGRLGEDHAFDNTSSADVTMIFDNGGAFTIPHPGLLHYVVSHDYMPSAEFVSAVMGHKVVAGLFVQTRSLTAKSPVSVGYLTEKGFPTGKLSEGFIIKLLVAVAAARRLGGYAQTKGFSINGDMR